MKGLLEALSRKGAREVLEKLIKSPKRFKDLAGTVKLSRRWLAKQLEDLEREGLVKREVATRERPPATKYHITPKGRKALNMISKLEKID